MVTGELEAGRDLPTEVTGVFPSQNENQRGNGSLGCCIPRGDRNAPSTWLTEDSGGILF